MKAKFKVKKCNQHSNKREISVESLPLPPQSHSNHQSRKKVHNQNLSNNVTRNREINAAKYINSNANFYYYDNQSMQNANCNVLAMSNRVNINNNNDNNNINESFKTDSDKKETTQTKLIRMTVGVHQEDAMVISFRPSWLMSKKFSSVVQEALCTSENKINTNLVRRDIQCVKFSVIIRFIRLLLGVAAASSKARFRAILHLLLLHCDDPVGKELTPLLDLKKLPLFHMSKEDFLVETENKESAISLAVQQQQQEQARSPPRPSYLIERDRHVFGGCLDDDAEDEFFISSGAVYQSWPYMYEPGFRTVRCFSALTRRLNKSLDSLVSGAPRLGHDYYASGEMPLEAYSLENFRVELFHTSTAAAEQSERNRSSHRPKSTGKRRRRLRRVQIADENQIYSKNENAASHTGLTSLVVNKNSNNNNATSCAQFGSGSSFLSVSFSSECLSTTNNRDSNYYYYYSESGDGGGGEDETGDEDDDSESFIAYKRRHAVGLLRISYNEAQVMSSATQTNSSNTNNHLKDRPTNRCRLSISVDEDNISQLSAVDQKLFCFLSQRRLGETYFNEADYCLLMQNQKMNHRVQNLFA